FTKYLFAYFTGDGGAQTEQIYFSTSKDGLYWDQMNDGNPVLKSTMGDKGVRDPFIIRSPEGDKFYLIATDLRIASGAGWGAAQTAGSQYIMVWESTDCVNWGEQRMCKVAMDTAGCTWAPEAFYDDETGEYVVFWASKVSDDNYSTHQIYYAATRDFYHFSEPKVWITLYNTSGDMLSIIDTSVIAVTDDSGKKTYYRFSKNESSTPISSSEPNGGKYTIMEKSDSLMGEWTRMDSDFLLDSSNQYREGGTCFKFNGEDKWCLLLDNFGGGGYYPCVTTDLGTGEFTKLSSEEYSFTISDGVIRHGTVIGLTEEEYKAVMTKWSTYVEDEEDSSNVPGADGLIADLNFDDTEQGFKGAGAIGTGSTSIAAGKSGVSGDNALSLTGSNFLNVVQKDGTPLLTGLDEVTISMDAKFDKSNGANWALYAAPGTAGPTYQWEKYLGILDQNNTITSERYNNSGSRGDNAVSIADTTTAWKNITLVIEKNSSKLYLDGELKATKSSTYLLSGILGKNSILQIGKANWGSGEYAVGLIDNLKIYNRALSESEVSDVLGNTTTSVKSIVFSSGSRMVPQNGTLQLTAKVYPTYASNQTLNWSSGDETIATVDDEGVVTGVKEGETTITATATDGSGVSVSCQITVGNSVEKINLTAEKTTLAEGSILQINAEILPEDATDTRLAWTSTDRSIANVIDGGLVTGISAGTATIRATSMDGSEVYGTIELTVTASVEEIKLSAEKTSIGVAETVKINTEIFPSGATNQELSWSSDNETVATVSADGKVTGNTIGTAVITATATDGSNQSSKITIRVCVPAESLSITAEDTKLSVGTSTILTAKVLPEGASEEVIWKSENTRIATVDEKGKVTAIAGGSVYIRATSKEDRTISGRMQLQVVIPVEKIQVTASKNMIRVDEALKMSVTVTPTTAINKKVLWSSTDEEVATVDKSGEVTGITVGKTTITATAADGSGVKGIYELQVIVPMKSLKIINKDTKVKERETLRLQTQILPKNASVTQLDWSTSDSKIATVDKSGAVTGVKEGKAVITGTAADGSRVFSKIEVSVLYNPVSDTDNDNNNGSNTGSDNDSNNTGADNSSSNDSSDSSSDSSSSGSGGSSKDKAATGTTPQTNADKTVSAGTDTSQIPSVPVESTTAEPTGQQPSTGGADGTKTIPVMPEEVKTVAVRIADDKQPWKEVEEVLEESLSDASQLTEVMVDMNGTTELAGKVLSSIAGRNIKLVLQLADGITWCVNGNSVTGDTYNDIDLGIHRNTDTIPADMIQQAAGENQYMQMELVHNGAFGFQGTLSINVEKVNAGYYANLFYYNEDTQKLEFRESVKVSEEGYADFTFDHASAYVIVFSAESMNAEMLANSLTTASTQKDSQNEMHTVNDQKSSSNNTAWIIFVIVLIVIAGGIVCYFVKKRDNEMKNNN
ncbi:MAG: Ig-like domain-containing protein, partial [Lachnospiraceae bacterium]|nr:Ig-like domain-containing protein [Lachnospiraceae bacterium]